MMRSRHFIVFSISNLLCMQVTFVCHLSLHLNILECYVPDIPHNTCCCCSVRYNYYSVLLFLEASSQSNYDAWLLATHSQLNHFFSFSFPPPSSTGWRAFSASTAHYSSFLQSRVVWICHKITTVCWRSLVLLSSQTWIAVLWESVE